MKVLNWLEDIAKSPIASLSRRDGQPFLQGSARNVAHAFLGDQNAYNFEHRYLGDTEQGNRYAGSDTPTNTGWSSLIQQTPQQMPPADDQEQQMLQLMMQRMQSQQTR